MTVIAYLGGVCTNWYVACLKDDVAGNATLPAILLAAAAVAELVLLCFVRTPESDAVDHALEMQRQRDAKQLEVDAQLSEKQLHAVQNDDWLTFDECRKRLALRRDES